MRDHNERLVLTLVRRDGPMPKAELARRTGLSAQTASVITRALEGDGLLRRGTPIRGRVGQPSIPLAIDPAGAYFFGLHIGRRRCELVLLDFSGQLLWLWHIEYRYPQIDEILRFLQQSIDAGGGMLGNTGSTRIAGLGIAIPFLLWQWADQAGAPESVRQAWKIRDIRQELDQLLSFPVMLVNDATAACSAELVFGSLDARFRDFIYLFVDTFIGGGVCLNRRVITGRSGNAGALGSMLVPDPGGETRQLIDIASLSQLERRCIDRGENPAVIWQSPDDWGTLEHHLDDWIAATAHGIAYAIVNASAVLDFEAAVIDGVVPDTVRTRLMEAVRKRLDCIPAEGIAIPEICEGTIGVLASARGAASLPLSERFLADSKALANL